MKMVKSLLLGTAAGLVAMTGAQAADLPVKAKPVQYVKICSLYGAGFYYIPGTDMCLKMGGWVRLQTHWNVNSNSTNGPMVGNRETRTDQNDFTWRSRGYITADARNQTEYGTLRSYMAVGFSTDMTTAFDSNRAFIQLAGFTFGKTLSFYDFYNQPVMQYFGYGGASDTGDAGKVVWAYTAQFGAGWSATIGVEDPRRSAVIRSDSSTSAVLAGALPTTTNTQIGVRYPDIVANLRLDGGWGAAQIMGALHDASGGYYGGSQNTGHPGDKMGWALGAGLKINAPMVAPGDYFQAQVNVARGASKYIANTQAGTAFSYYKGGNSYGYGVYTDAIYSSVAGSNLELTSIWGVNAGYEHFWNPRWQTSLWTAYNRTTYSDAGNASLCNAENNTASGLITTGSLVGTCNNNFSILAIGTRTQWNIDSSTYIGLEVVYQKLYTANGGNTASVIGSGAQPSQVRNIENQQDYALRLQIHRNFYP